MLKKIKNIIGLVFFISTAICFMALPTSVSAKPKQTYFILQNFAGFKSNLQQIANPTEHSLILLANEKKIKDLSAEQRAIFSEIHAVKEFDFENLKKITMGIICRNAIPNTSFNFISNDEYSLEITGRLRDFFKINGPTHQVLNLFLNKDLMKQALADNDSSIRIPKYITFNKKEYLENPKKYTEKVMANLPFPIFAKPINDAGAHLTEKLVDANQLIVWLENNSNNKTSFELDEFIEGEMYHCDSLVKNGEIIFSKVWHYNYPGALFLHGKPNGSIILEEKNYDTIEIKKFNKKVLKALSPVPNGATHLEVFKTPKGELVFVEIAARTPGAYIPKAYLKAFHFSIEEAHFKLQMGVPCGNTCQAQEGPAIAWVWYPSQRGTVTNIQSPIINSQKIEDWKIKAGDQLTQAIELKDWAFGLVLWNDSPKLLQQDFNYLSNYSPYRLSKLAGG